MKGSLVTPLMLLHVGAIITDSLSVTLLYHVTIFTLLYKLSYRCMHREDLDKPTTFDSDDRGMC